MAYLVRTGRGSYYLNVHEVDFKVGLQLVHSGRLWPAKLGNQSSTTTHGSICSTDKSKEACNAVVVSENGVRLTKCQNVSCRKAQIQQVTAYMTQRFPFSVLHPCSWLVFERTTKSVKEAFQPKDDPISQPTERPTKGRSVDPEDNLLSKIPPQLGLFSWLPFRPLCAFNHRNWGLSCLP